MKTIKKVGTLVTIVLFALLVIQCKKEEQTKPVQDKKAPAPVAYNGMHGVWAKDSSSFAHYEDDSLISYSKWTYNPQGTNPCDSVTQEYTKAELGSTGTQISTLYDLCGNNPPFESQEPIEYESFEKDSGTFVLDGLWKTFTLSADSSKMVITHYDAYSQGGVWNEDIQKGWYTRIKF